MTKKQTNTEPEAAVDAAPDEPVVLGDDEIAMLADAATAAAAAPPAAAEQFAPFMGCPPREILSVVAHEDGHIVTTFDGGQYLVGPDGNVARFVEAADDTDDADAAVASEADGDATVAE